MLLAIRWIPRVMCLEGIDLFDMDMDTEDPIVKEGMMVGAIEAGVDPRSIPYMQSKSAKLTTTEGHKVGRLLLKVGYDVMRMAGKADTPAAQHLKWAHEMPEWNAHCQEVADTVGATIYRFDPPGQTKQAGPLAGIGNLLSGAGSFIAKAPQTALYGSLAGGGTLGLLYWLLNREAQRDRADIQSLQNQTDMYRDLGSEIEKSLKRRYNYDINAERQGKQQRPEPQQEQSRSFGGTRGSTAAAL